MANICQEPMSTGSRLLYVFPLPLPSLIALFNVRSKGEKGRGVSIWRVWWLVVTSSNRPRGLLTPMTPTMYHVAEYQPAGPMMGNRSFSLEDRQLESFLTASGPSV